MANNLQKVFPQILTEALSVLRESSLMPSLVNTSYSDEAAKKGDKIDIPLHLETGTQPVVPGAVSNFTPDTEMASESILLNEWEEAAFFLTDKDLNEIMDGIPNGVIQTKARALANFVNLKLLGLYKKAWNYHGTAGVTPFATDHSAAAQVGAVLFDNLAPDENYKIVLDSQAYANAIALPAFAYYLNSGDTNAMSRGRLGEKYGLDWYRDNHMRSIFHTAGTLSGATTSAAPVATVPAPIEISRGTVTCTATNGQTVKEGDIFTVAGDAQTYVVKANATAAGSAVTIQFAPAPKVQWTTGSAVTLKASHANNLVFHPQALALAMRPYVGDQYAAELKSSMKMTMVDPVSGIPMLLTVKEEHYRMRWSLSILFGFDVIRPQWLLRLAG